MDAVHPIAKRSGLLDAQCRWERAGAGEFGRHRRGENPAQERDTGQQEPATQNPRKADAEHRRAPGTTAGAHSRSDHAWLQTGLQKPMNRRKKPAGCTPRMGILLLGFRQRNRKHHHGGTRCAKGNKRPAWQRPRLRPGAKEVPGHAPQKNMGTKRYRWTGVATKAGMAICCAPSESSRARHAFGEQCD